MPCVWFLHLHSRWYISIAPTGSLPGTDGDIDFYYAEQPEDEEDDYPQEITWRCLQNGRMPCPTVYIGNLVFEGEGDD